MNELNQAHEDIRDKHSARNDGQMLTAGSLLMLKENLPVQQLRERMKKYGRTGSFQLFLHKTEAEKEQSPEQAQKHKHEAGSETSKKEADATVSIKLDKAASAKLEPANNTSPNEKQNESQSSKSTSHVATPTELGEMVKTNSGRERLHLIMQDFLDNDSSKESVLLLKRLFLDLSKTESGSQFIKSELPTILETNHGAELLKNSLPEFLTINGGKKVLESLVQELIETDKGREIFKQLFPLLFKTENNIPNTINDAVISPTKSVAAEKNEEPAAKTTSKPTDNPETREKPFEQKQVETKRHVSDQSKPQSETKAEQGNEKTEKWGKRDFEMKNDESADYKIQRGDTLWSIARDVLKHKHEGEENYKPSPREIRDEVNKIAKENNIANPDKILAGDSLHIAKDGRESVDTATHNENRESRALHKNRTHLSSEHLHDAQREKQSYSKDDKTNQVPEKQDEETESVGPSLGAHDILTEPRSTQSTPDKEYHPFAPPGFGGFRENNEELMDAKRSLVESKHLGSKDAGLDIQKYEGTYKDSGFSAEEHVDVRGHVIFRKVDYAGDNVAITLKGATGNNIRLEHVKSVTVTYNAATKRYDSVLCTKDGNKYHFETKQNGEMVKFETKN